MKNTVLNTVIRITIWKEPLKVRMRTMVQSLMHKFIVEDSTKCLLQCLTMY
jgi:hypothetical protein